jgi:hypothetical protein
VHPLFLILPAAIGLLTILLAAIWALAQEPAPLASCRLPDGSVLRLEAVTVGKQHRFVSGKRWQRMVARLLPAGMTGGLRGLIHERRGSGPGEVVFRTVWRPVQLSPASGTVMNENSGPFKTEHLREPPGADGQLTCWVARQSPHKGARIALRLRQSPERGPTGTRAEFRVPNPFR